MKSATATGVVRTRQITTLSPDGKRLMFPKWGKPRIWKRYTDTLSNLEQAIDYGAKALANRRMGTIVYVNTVPVYHFKFGVSAKTGPSFFSGWKSNPVARYWKNRAAQARK